MRVADFIAEVIERKKVSHVFGVGGANIEDMFSAVQRLLQPPRRSAGRSALSRSQLSLL